VACISGVRHIRFQILHPRDAEKLHVQNNLEMARKGRVIGVVLGLILILLLLSSRNARSHPRDMRTALVPETREGPPIIKEPPGRWDAVEDKFQDSLASHLKGIQEQLDEVSKQTFDIPDEGIQVKPPRKGDSNLRKLENKAKGEPKQFGVGGNGAVNIGKQGPDVKRYDPAAGLCPPKRVLISRSRTYSHSGSPDRMYPI
jgi:hypothetical protein